MARFDMRTQSCVDDHLIVEPSSEGSTIDYLSGIAITEVVIDLSDAASRIPASPDQAQWSLWRELVTAGRVYRRA